MYNNISFYHDEYMQKKFQNLSKGFIYICAFICPYDNSKVHIIQDIQEGINKNSFFLFAEDLNPIQKHIYYSKKITDLETFKTLIINTYADTNLCNQLIKQQILKDL